MMKKTIKTEALGLLGLTACLSNAVVLVTPTSITYTTAPNQEQGGLNLDNETNLINGNGLSETPTFANYSSLTHAAVSFGAPGNTWATIDPGPGAGDFYADGGIAPVFVMTLDQTYPLSDFVYWGYHFGAAGGNEGREFLLEFSTDGGANYATSTTVSSPLNTFAVQNALTLSLGGIYDANAIRMTVTDNHFGGAAAGGDRVGLAELRFIAIPEPATGLLLGFAALVGLRRRR